MRRSLPRFAYLLLLAVLCQLPASGARPDEWRDAAGKRFRGDPTEVLGPFVVFRTSRATGLRLALQQLSPEDCVRVHAAVGQKPPPAADWSQAQGRLSREVYHFTYWMQEGRRIPAVLKDRQEPLLYVVFFASHGEGKSWEMMGQAAERWSELKQRFPGQVEGLYLGLRHNASDHLAMASRMNLPWLVTEYNDQHEFQSVNRLFPGSGYAMFVVTRDGVPLFGDNNPEKADVTRILGEMQGLLELVRPGDPRSWPHRLHYLRAIRPVIHAADRAEPELVGDPLRPDALKQHGVRRVVATLQIAADGAVTGVTMEPESRIPEPLIPAVAQAVEKALVVPAIDHGTPVAGTLTYTLEIDE